MTNVLISPSILSADFGKLAEEIESVEGEADYLHIDVMDGHFVPKISFGVTIMKWIKTELPMHAHLMVSNPEAQFKDFVAAGAAMVIFHYEATKDAAGLIKQIKGADVKVGISIKPNTPAEALEGIIEDLDQVLVMSVEPGAGGQSFMKSSLDKISTLRLMREDLQIAVDGGIDPDTAPLVMKAGADVLIAGSYIFESDDRAEAIRKLKTG